jgi:hypothetical protein
MKLYPTAGQPVWRNYPIQHAIPHSGMDYVQVSRTASFGFGLTFSRCDDTNINGEKKDLH